MKRTLLALVLLSPLAAFGQFQSAKQGFQYAGMFATSDLRTATGVVNNGDAAQPSGAGQACITTDTNHCTWQAVASGSGTVTSVGNGTIGALFSVSWATATTTPALSLNLAAQTSNCVVASPANGTSAVPTCRSLVVADFNSGTSASSSTFWRGDGTWATPASGAVASEIAADPNFTTGTYYERSGGFLQMKPVHTWSTTIADCKANPPAGWTWSVTTRVTSCDENTTTANAIRQVHSNAFDGQYSNPSTQGALYKDYARATGVQTWVGRGATNLTDIANIATQYVIVGVYDANATTSSNMALVDVTKQSGNVQVRCITANALAGTGAATITAADAVAGVWGMVTIDPQGVSNCYYSLSTSTTPPTSGWLPLTGSTTQLIPTGPRRAIAGAPVAASAPAATFSMDLLYYDDSQNSPWLNLVATAATAQTCSTGCDNSLTSVTLIADANIGAGTLSDATINSVFTEVGNTRLQDTGTATCRFARDTTTPTFSGAWAACTSQTSVGSGSHLAIQWRCDPGATKNTQCSLNLSRLLFPVTP